MEIFPIITDHGVLTGLSDDDHSIYWADTTIGTRTKSYATTGPLASGIHTMTSDSAANIDFITMVNTRGVGVEGILRLSQTGTFNIISDTGSVVLTPAAGVDISLVLSGGGDLLFATGGDIGRATTFRPDNMFAATNITAGSGNVSAGFDVIAGHQFLAEASSVSSPAFSFVDNGANEDQTGIYLISDTPAVLGFTTDGVFRMAIDDTGVGVGTASPDQQLEVRGVSPIIRIRATGDIDNAAAYVEFGRTTDGDWVRTGYVGDGISSNEDIYLVAEDNDLKLGDSSSNAVLTLSGGNATFSGDVRIGTATNYANLAVGSDGDLTITTVDSDGTDGDITFAPDGKTIITGNLDINLSGGSGIKTDEWLLAGVVPFAELVGTGAFPNFSIADTLYIRDRTADGKSSLLFTNPTGTIAGEIVYTITSGPTTEVMSFEGAADGYTFDNDTYWVGAGSGLAYGGMFLHNGGVTIDCVGGNFIKITGLGSVGLLNNVTYSTSALRADKVGVYKVSWECDADAAAANKDFEFAIYLNEVEVQQGSSHTHSAPTAGDEFSVSGTALIDVTSTAHDIDLRVKNITDDTDIDILDVSFNIIQVGGT